jgi:undecaprenyl-diphosphatase
MHEIVKLIAKDAIALSILGLIYCWFKLDTKRKKTFLIQLVAAGILTYLAGKLAAALYYDPRPFISDHVVPYFASATDNGFPSDHTLLASFAGFMTLWYNRKLGAALLVLAALIGIARVTAGVHHGADVLGAFGASFIGVGLIWAVSKLVLNRYSLQKS